MYSEEESQRHPRHRNRRRCLRQDGRWGEEPPALCRVDGSLNQGLKGGGHVESLGFSVQAEPAHRNQGQLPCYRVLGQSVTINHEHGRGNRSFANDQNANCRRTKHQRSHSGSELGPGLATRHVSPRGSFSLITGRGAFVRSRWAHCFASGCRAFRSASQCDGTFPSVAAGVEYAHWLY